MSNPRIWARDLGLGIRFAVTGGREAWVRTLLTAVGVGLGVALLLVTAALPTAMNSREARGDDRNDNTFSSQKVPAAEDTLVISAVDTDFRSKSVRGRLVAPDGAKAPLPPGVSAHPKPGEMVVSPALAELLKSDDGKMLRDRLQAKQVGTISDAGLIGPGELAYYAGAEKLVPNGYPTMRIDHFGPADSADDPFDPVLVLLTLLVFVVLLMPVGVFIAAAVRFGGERRDRRLAALRLIGADGRMTRRIAAGESLAGALLGLAVGTGFFLITRAAAADIEVLDVSVFPADLDPSPALALLVGIAVPAAAVAVTLFALRSVVIEPLGVVRTAKQPRRKLWWRLLLPIAGLAMLYPMVGQGRDGGRFNEWLVTAGVVLLLVGITALLPWLVEAVVVRLGRGSLSWQLAVRRLQLSSGTAARMVNGIAVAVAGAIALQMMFAGVQGDYTSATGQDPRRAELEVHVPDSGQAEQQMQETLRRLKQTKGIDRITAPLMTMEAADGRTEPDRSTTLNTGTCSALRELARITSCKDGDVFIVSRTEDIGDDEDATRLAKAGKQLYLDPSYDGYRGKQVPWKVPTEVREVTARDSPGGYANTGILATPGALTASGTPNQSGTLWVSTDNSDRDAAERVRNAAAATSPFIDIYRYKASDETDRFASLRTGLYVGAIAVLALIGASLLVSQLEQLRERRKLLSSLVAFGTRKRTLSLSVLWQTALPVALGLTLATVVGLTLGSVLLKMVDRPISPDWASLGAMTAAGAGVVLVVTALSMPPLIRLMRPDGLRTE
ncbi:FtsX-like permease family protein [Streptomyces sp. YIM 130001]|uniref:ABC transporter permease n=1 Tax=Streptomyces sp. YIM 130001 TaxID=2259644 RepID=UPI000E658BC7|nr:FtsX-like permease family protein [Streptomyces sp. YIM 130001]RII20789.1 FtsX-like permease family protein [Streptomyces sp. YIM 130001]